MTFREALPVNDGASQAQAPTNPDHVGGFLRGSWDELILSKLRCKNIADQTIIWSLYLAF